jgi:hypothetical protein
MQFYLPKKERRKYLISLLLALFLYTGPYWWTLDRKINLSAEFSHNLGN